MLEALFSLVFEVVLYSKGYWTLQLVSAGRIQPKRWNDSLVALVGLVATLVWCVPLLLWLSSLR